MSNHYLPMPGNFSDKWISRMWIRLKGLSPAISIDQKTTSRNPRSTVGTVTEIYDYLRLLYARVGRPTCPTHGIEITSQTIEQMVDRILEYPERTKMQILGSGYFRKKRSTCKSL